jgi:beta-N-acetylhexosaminidase
MRWPLRVAALALALGLTACGGGGGGEGSRPSTSTASSSPSASPPPRRAPRRTGLTLRQQVGQVLVISFGGTSPPDYVRRALREGRAAGVILFGGNVESPAQVRALTGSLQRASGRGALVATDQEGGEFHILPWAAPHEGEPAQATPAAADGAARGAVRDLHAAGVNVTLAPVADVGRRGSALAARTFPGAPGAVAANVGAAVRAYRAGGVAATAKHFPGLGAAAVNTDNGAATVRLTAADLVPFKAAVAAGVPLVMVSHAVYPNLDPGRLASQSPTVMRDLLRGRLGYRGVVVTDSMEARAVIQRSSIEVACERALAAGADLLLLTGDGSFRPVSRALLARARRDRAFRARVADAAARVLALKRSLGLRPPATARAAR